MTDAVDPGNSNRFTAHSVKCFDGARLVMRCGQLVIGGAMLITALGIWFVQGAIWAHDLLPMQLVVSSVAVVIGLLFVQMSCRPDAPKVEIDTIQHEVRLVRESRRDRFVLDRCRFADLSRVEDSGTHVQLWGKKGKLLAEVAASDRPSHRDLVTALRVAGKL